MADSCTAKVKGTSAVLPRGYPWVLGGWYAIMGVILASVTGFPSPSSAALVAVLLVGGLYLMNLLRNAKHNAFAADADGIRLGVRQVTPKRAQRLCTQIPWSQIQEIRVFPAAEGSTVDIVLAASAPVPRSPAMPAPVTIALAALPFSYLLQRPALLHPLTSPSRYRVPLFRTSATEIAASLRSLAPASVPLAEMTPP